MWGGDGCILTIPQFGAREKILIIDAGLGDHMRVFIKSSGLALSMNPFRIEIQSPKMDVDGLDIAWLLPEATTPDFEALNAAIHTL